MKHLTDSQLNEYLDHALGKSTRREADLHLQSCAVCRARLDELQNVFTALTGLPEARPARDLSTSILSRLPQKQPRVWAPFFAAQVGAALGVFLWLSTQITKFIPASFSAFRLPSFTMPAFPFSNLYSLFSILHPLFSIPTFNFPTFQLSIFNMIFIALSVSTLWVFGNAALLRNRQEVQK